MGLGGVCSCRPTPARTRRAAGLAGAGQGHAEALDWRKARRLDQLCASRLRRCRGRRRRRRRTRPGASRRVSGGADADPGVHHTPRHAVRRHVPRRLADPFHRGARARRAREGCARQPRRLGSSSGGGANAADSGGRRRVCRAVQERWARPGHISTGTGPAPAKSAPRLGSGVDLKLEAVHPLTGQRVPVWAAEYAPACALRRNVESHRRICAGDWASPKPRIAHWKVCARRGRHRRRHGRARARPAGLRVRRAARPTRPHGRRPTRWRTSRFASCRMLRVALRVACCVRPLAWCVLRGVWGYRRCTAGGASATADSVVYAGDGTMVNSADLDGLSTSEAQASPGRSRCRCGSAEPSPGADVGGVSPVPVQMWEE